MTTTTAAQKRILDELAAGTYRATAMEARTRTALIRRGLIVENPQGGTPYTTWSLTDAGRAAIAAA